MSINRVVAYGCSLTAGMELADHLIDNAAILKKKYSIAQWYEHVYQIINEDEFLRLENEQSWVRWLADKFDVPYLNRAVHGGNGQLSTYLLEQDIANGILKKTDLVIVGQTEPSRWFWLTNKGVHKCCCVGGTDDRWPSKTFHKEFITHVNNDYHMPYHWFNSIKYIELLSKNFDGILKQQFCINTYDDNKQNNNIKPELYLMMDAINTFESVIDCKFSFTNIVDWNNPSQVHEFTHPKVEYHRMFADHLFSKL